MMSELGHLLFGGRLLCINLNRPRVGLGHGVRQDLVRFLPGIRDHRVGSRLGRHEDTTDGALIHDGRRFLHWIVCLGIEDLVLKFANRRNDVIEKVVNLIEVITSKDC